MTQRRFEQLRERALALLTATDAAKVVEEMAVLHAELELQADELQRSQRASNEARRLYSELFRCAPVGLLVLDSVNLIMEANEAAAEFLQTTPRLLFGVMFSQFVAPQDLSKWGTFTQRPRPTEFAVRQWGGGRAVAVLRLLQLDEQTRLLAIEDVTLLRSVVSETARRADSFQAFFRAAPEATLVVDERTHRVVDASDRACDLLRAPRPELIDRSHDELFPASERARGTLLLDQLRAQPGTWGQSVIRTHEGLDVPVQLKVSLPSPGGLRLVTVKDTRGPDEVVDEAAVPAAVPARLSSAVVHDLNNVLSAIRSTLEVLSRAGVPAEAPEWQEGLADLEAAASLGARIVRGALSPTLEAPRPGLPFSLKAAVEEAARVLQRSLPPTVRLELVVPAEACVVEGDPGDWERAVVNLGLNALDAMPSGGVIEVRLKHQTDGCELVVHDQGLGMSPEVLSRAGEPFFTTKPAGKGAGLGLAQVAATVRASQGQLRVTSEPGQGTSAFLRVPHTSRAHPTPAPVSSTTGGDRRVLLVEDEPIVRRALSRQLSRLGFVVQAAASGAEALHLLAESDPQVVLSDLSMPGMNGLTLAARVRELRPQLPIVIMSGHVPAELRPQLEALHVAQIDKPFSERTLCAALLDSRT